MENRTSKGIKNTKVAMAYYIIAMVLGFVSRRVFINHIGIDVLGLNTTAQNLLGFINLAELGIGTAVAFTLYKPLAEHDTEAVTEIVTVQGWLYRRIAYFVVLCSCILMLFFPLIFEKTELPLWYAYATFCIYLYSSLLTYFVNYKQIVLSANQEEYKITYSYKFVSVLQSILQIIAISLFDHGFVWWLALHFGFSTLAAYSLGRTIRKGYPYLRIELSRGRQLASKYTGIITRIKQVFVHRIAGFVLQQTSPLIIYAFSTLTLVAVYGNYMLIVGTITMMFQSAFNGVNAGVGNLVAEENDDKIRSVFEELFTSRFLVATTFCFCFFVMSDSFMEIWVGREYVLNGRTLLLIVAIMYINLTRTTVDAFISAYGLYNDIYAPMVEAMMNLGLSIYLGSNWGIDGILLGVLVSLVVIVLGWKPVFLLWKGVKMRYVDYLILYAKHLVAFTVSAFASFILYNCLHIYMDTSILSTWFVLASLILLFFFTMELALLYAFIKGMKMFVCRLKRQIVRKN